MYRSINPTTEELLKEYPFYSNEQLEGLLQKSHKSFLSWRQESVSRRLQNVEKLAAQLEHKEHEYARLIALEMGKPLSQGLQEIEKCARLCRYYVEQADSFLQESIRTDLATVRYDPLGVILGIMPWNFPFWQVFRFALPALITGNTCLLKHAPNVPQVALAIEELFQAADFPAGIFQNLFISHDQVQVLLADRRLQGVSLTGSTSAGKKVAQSAGRYLKKCVLELGGSDPFIVFEDANLEAAAKAGVVSRCLNSGQSCIAAKRFLIQASVFEPFKQLFLQELQNQNVGDPLDPNTTIGPLARQDLRDTLASQVESSLSLGAEVAYASATPRGPGFWYPASCLLAFRSDMPLFTEEIFGPVASLQSFEREEKGLEQANATVFGLGASLWTSDRKRAERLIPRLEAGCVFINEMVKSDPHLPFGGVKDSGFGRELSQEGLLEFVNCKSVWKNFS